MLITPAMASEPYCDEAPSRRTSMRWIARPGIKFRSTAALPRPTVPLMLSNDETWRRLPLTRTRVWSGLRPRSVAGRNASVPSAIEGCGKLNEGTRSLRILLVSVWPELAIASAFSTSTGTGLSATVRSVRRVPVTMIGASGSLPRFAAAGAAGGETCADVGEAASASDDKVDNRTTRARPDISFPLKAPNVQLRPFSHPGQQVPDAAKKSPCLWLFCSSVLHGLAPKASAFASSV